VTFRAVQQETNAVPRSDFTVDPLDANHLWTSDYFGFASSSNGGKSFAPHNRGLLSYGEAQGTFALSDVAIDDFHRPPGGEKHTLWMLNAIASGARLHAPWRAESEVLVRGDLSY